MCGFEGGECLCGYRDQSSLGCEKKIAFSRSLAHLEEKRIKGMHLF